MGKKKHAVVYNVLPDSIADEVEISKGDKILSINGEEIIDIFDYRFAITNEEITIEVEKANGEIWEVEIEKDEYEEIGIEFENDLINECKSCQNKCLFCFIDQLPPNMRKTVYFKDDDPRLSFLTGNYVTLTNTSDKELERIIKYKLTPVNVSVHTTDKELRVQILNNKKAGEILDKIKKLVSNGIEVNCQIVLMRDVNDKEYLEKTIKELHDISPRVRSISIVPVGISKFREGLFKLTPFDKESSSEVIDQVSSWQDKFYNDYGSRVLFLADEFYIMAEREIPELDHYEDFPQIENGVGLMAQFKHEVYETINNLKDPKLDKFREVTIATGVSAYGYISEFANKLENKHENLKINVYPIINEFFGDKVTVTGLITGSDIEKQISNKSIGDVLLLSESMFKDGEDIFLDDTTLSGLEKKLNIKIEIVQNTGNDFVNKIIGKESV
jgi:putative radical SAM enzyme (TIGR03279 family)